MSQCSHLPHRQCLERRRARGHWMPASHSNGPPTHTFKPFNACGPLQRPFRPYQRVEFRRLRATLSLDHGGSQDPDRILYGFLSGSLDAHQERLRSRRPFVLAALNLLDNLAGLSIRASEWTNHK